MTKRYKNWPAEEGFRMPAEYEPHEGTLMIWPERPGSWNYGAAAAREAFARIILELAKSETVYVMVSEASKASAEKALADAENVRLIDCETDDAWARDTGATFVVKGGQRRGIDWQFNAWGGDYNGLYASWDKDQEVAAAICQALGDDIFDQRDFVLEGGSIHTDGEGTLLVTEECLLSPGRNPHLTKEDIEDHLAKTLGISKVIWLPRGIYNDETDGHVDNFCCFTSPGRVLLAWTDDENDPQYERSLEALHILENETDARGRSFYINKLPIPSPILITEEDLQGYEFEEGEDLREVGERLAASYINFYVANASVLVPQFGDPMDQTALDILAECFPDREIIGIPARVILTGGGNIHCITQQIPRKGETHA